MKTRLLYVFLILAFYSCSNSEVTQFVLFDQEFTFTYQDAISSSPNKSHYYVTNEKLSPTVPKDWAHPVDFRNGTVHIRIEVIEKPKGNEPTKWTLCYIPNKGKGNMYGCTSTDLFTAEGVYEKEVSMNEF